MLIIAVFPQAVWAHQMVPTALAYSVLFLVCSGLAWGIKAIAKTKLKSFIIILFILFTGPIVSLFVLKIWNPNIVAVEVFIIFTPLLACLAWAVSKRLKEESNSANL
jgi:hypothetical protein